MKGWWTPYRRFVAIGAALALLVALVAATLA